MNTGDNIIKFIKYKIHFALHLLLTVTMSNKNLKEYYKSFSQQLILVENAVIEQSGTRGRKKGIMT